MPLILDNWNTSKEAVYLVLTDNASTMKKTLRDADLPKYVVTVVLRIPINW